MSFRLLRIRGPVVAAALATLTAGAMADPVLWIDDASGRLGKVDVATGAVTMVGSMGTVMTDIAFAPNGNLYGISFSALYRIDPATAATTLIGNTGSQLNSLVFNADGTLYAANNSLYTLDLGTGAATRLGNGGAAYSSSGDLAFVGGNLYLSSSGSGSDNLMQLDLATGSATRIGAIGVSNVYGLATNDNVHLYGVAGTGVYAIDTTTGAGTRLVDYGGHGLSAANGTSFITEAAPPVPAVPEPETYALMLLGLGAVGWAARRKKR